MKVDLFLVKDEYSTIANFRCATKAQDFASKSKNLTVERIEVELPQFRYVKTVNVENSPVTQSTIPVASPTDKVEDIINAHILNVYNKLGKNKTHAAKALGLTTKTVANKLKGIVNE